MREKWRQWCLVGLVMAYVGVLILAPLAMLVAGALQDGVGTLLRSLTAPEMRAAFRLTVLIGVIVVAVHAVFGTVVAWVLVRDRFHGRRLANSLVDLPFAVSPVVVGYMLFLLFGRNGMLAPILAPFGIQVVFALPGMILATLFVTLPFMIRELMPVLEAMGTDQEQASATMGASGLRTFVHVTLPALRWGFAYGLTLTFARALGEFGAVLVVGGGIQGHTETATLYIYRALDERQYVAGFSAALVLAMLSILLVTGTDFLRKK